MPAAPGTTQSYTWLEFPVTMVHFGRGVGVWTEKLVVGVPLLSKLPLSTRLLACSEEKSVAMNVSASVHAGYRICLMVARLTVRDREDKIIEGMMLEVFRRNGESIRYESP